MLTSVEMVESGYISDTPAYEIRGAVMDMPINKMYNTCSLLIFIDFLLSLIILYYN